MYEQDHSTREALSKEQHEMLPMIQTLPTDVLREIFQRCLPPFRYQESVVFELDKPPYTLAKVCRHWRSVCLSMPLLWVDLPTLFTDENPFTPEFSRHWRAKLTLSSPCDLRLYLCHYVPIPDAVLTECLQPIQPAFGRVRVLDLRTNAQMLEAISEHVDLFKRLQILKISMIHDYTATNPFPQLGFNSKIASLTLQSRKRVEISQRLLKCVETLWPSLTKFDGDYLPASSLREILASAPLLVQLTIRNVQAAQASASPTSPQVIHTHLKMLQILKSQQSARKSDILDLSGIRLPELEDLVVQNAVLSDTFLSFLEQTQGSLRNLYIGVFRLSHHQRAIYELCPRLEGLTIVQANDESLKHLTLTGSSGNKPMCPRLRCLTLPLFRLNPELEYDVPSLWLSELTRWRFSTPNAPDSDAPIDCVPLESLTIVVTKASNFLHFRHFQNFLSMDYCLTISAQKSDLTRFEKYIQQNPYSICFLDDLGIISRLKEFAEEKAQFPDMRLLQDEARKIYADLMALLADMRAKPHWKMEKDPHVKKRYEKFVFKNHLVSQS